MTTHAEDSVLVDREHFETLVRRANTTSVSALGPPGLTILLSRAEHDALCLVAKQYANLRQNLLRGGVDERTVDILSADDASVQADSQNDNRQPMIAINRNSVPAQVAAIRPPPGFQSHSGTAYVNDRADLKSSDGYSCESNGQDGGYTQGYRHGQHRLQLDPSADSISWADTGCLPDDDNSQAYGGHDPIHDDTEHPEISDHDYNQTKGQHHAPDRNCLRTVQLVNIPSGTTHGDVAAVVRGGIVLEIYIRGHDHSAMISFHRGADAMAFFEHARKHDFYVKNKRVDVRWSDRQFTMNGMVANKVQQGATRNLTIYRPDPHITEHRIRDDLDHIHNLVVISVTFTGTTCIVKTNSVHNALFARSCLMSRAIYKGSKIGWAADECAQPFREIAPVVRPKRAPPQAKKPPVFAARNRFQLLNLDGGSAHESSDDEDEAEEDNENNDDNDDETETEDSASDIHGGGALFSTASLSSVNTMDLLA